MTITIHRGTHQIGGCATEICSGDTRIIIDMGSELPGVDGIIPEETLSIPGVTDGELNCDGIFFIHAHGDHIGQLERIPESIPLYMGRTAKELCKILNHHLNSVPSLDKTTVLNALDRVRTFQMAERIRIGSITVTPFWIDHSAFDAYMFLIEVEGLRILHTGDFRLHGYRGRKTIPMLKKYVGQVDWVICEGTMLSRTTEKVMTEYDLQSKARGLMKQHKRVFVLCSSMNIDRIAGMIHARPDNRPVICDPYQKKILKFVEKTHGHKARLYRFGRLECNVNHLLIDNGYENGCLALIRANDWSRKLLSYYDDAKVIYSMWDGYLEGKTANQKLISLLDGYEPEYLHTSGHAAADELREVMDVLRPRKGIIPIHTEAPQKFQELFPQYHIFRLSDRETAPL
ncbi:MAG: MBL fold metallo-hydrolase [Oscillospiraceae bacterium]|nr:MBL fold metallo-hydrolase [Oscillospiraceae bacterium]